MTFQHGMKKALQIFIVKIGMHRWILTPGSEDLDCEGFLFVSFQAGEGGEKTLALGRCRCLMR